MKKIFTVLAWVQFLAVIVQFFLAATGAVKTSPTEQAFSAHRMLGYSILLVAVVVTLAGAVAKMPGRIVGMAGLVIGLVLVQVLIREVAKAIGDDSTAGALVFGLHAINGLFLMGLTEQIAQRARKIAWPPVAEARLGQTAS
ncbi:DUF6220 domain-containing protein [Labedaea rhizosphaerae]|uniref:Cytochrome b561 domain-containing protein n=1 Tax=Labedaea rhizosphaerae TaxID=598644 RepID=A0A4R6S0F9_LABRH|nr:DUF6220 domain-containing protein [Labedaea rhizosphaerae]TDP92972.1 hypothetical protein EV186_107207 [Labedaea rhizosphaerae]